MTSSLGSICADAAQGFEAVHAAHAHVHQHEVGLELGNDLQPFLAARGGGQLDFRRIKNPLERIPHVLFVINQQQLAHVEAAQPLGKIANCGAENSEK